MWEISVGDQYRDQCRRSVGGSLVIVGLKPFHRKIELSVGAFILEVIVSLFTTN